jgi:hypothetical protein
MNMKALFSVALSAILFGACASRKSDDETAAFGADDDNGSATYFYVFFKQFKVNEKLDWQTCLWHVSGSDLGVHQRQRGQGRVLEENFQRSYFTHHTTKNLTATPNNAQGFYVTWGSNSENKADLMNYIRNNVKGSAGAKNKFIQFIADEHAYYGKLLTLDPAGSAMTRFVSYVGDDLDQDVNVTMRDLISKARNVNNHPAMGVTKNLCPQKNNVLKQDW